MDNNLGNVVDNFVDKGNKNLKLMAAVTLYRYQCELKMIEDDIDGNKPVATHDKSKFERTIIDNTVNAFRRNQTQKLSNKKRTCLDNMAAFKEKCKKDGIEIGEVTEESLKKLADSTFEGDDFNLQRICFAMLLCMQGEEDANGFIFGDKTLGNVSKVLFDDEMRINYIKDKFYANFKEISNGSFWDRNKNFIMGAGISLVLVSVLTPVVLTTVAASSAVLTSCLAQIGHCAPGIIGLGVAKVTGMAVLGTALLGGVAFAGIGVNEIIKCKQAKDAFRALSPNDLAAFLAMKATLIDYGTLSMDDERYKTELDECLKGLNDLRSDAEYMLIVEKNDADNSKKKIGVCNRFVSRLATIAGI